MVMGTFVVGRFGRIEDVDHDGCRSVVTVDVRGRPLESASR